MDGRKVMHNSVAKDSQKAGHSERKGGAGGKGTWGAVGSEYEPTQIDRNDPNFDPSEDPNYTMEATE